MNKKVQKFNNFSNLLHLINSGGIIILKVNSISSFSFNEFLKTDLEISYPNQIQYAEIDEIEIIQDDFTSSFTRLWIKSLSLVEQRGLPSGYYLFVNKDIRAYHPASINLQERSTKTAGAIGLLYGMFTKNVGKGIKTFSTVFKIRQASSISDFFKQTINNNNSQSRQQKQQHEFVKPELDYAYEIIGVKRNSTIEEIKKARKILMKEYHPDLNPNNREECTKYCATINNAFDLIMKSKGK